MSIYILYTGTLAILVAQPTDVVKVRMQAAGSKKAYKVQPEGGAWLCRVIIYTVQGVFDAYKTIGKVEGLQNGLYRGERA